MITKKAFGISSISGWLLLGSYHFGCVKAQQEVSTIIPNFVHALQAPLPLCADIQIYQPITLFSQIPRTPPWSLCLTLYRPLKKNGLGSWRRSNLLITSALRDSTSISKEFSKRSSGKIQVQSKRPSLSYTSAVLGDVCKLFGRGCRFAS